MEEIVIERIYEYSVEHVWEALTDPDALAEWLMPGDFKAVVGHRVRFHCEPRPEFDGIVDVEVLAVEKPRRLSYTWKTTNMDQPTIVTFLLTPTNDNGTHLRLEHTGFEGDSGRRMHSMFKDGWGHKLETLLPESIKKSAS